jgi:hypothetical protein
MGKPKNGIPPKRGGAAHFLSEIRKVNNYLGRKYFWKKNQLRKNFPNCKTMFSPFKKLKQISYPFIEWDTVSLAFFPYAEQKPQRHRPAKTLSPFFLLKLVILQLSQKKNLRDKM